MLLDESGRYLSPAQCQDFAQKLNRTNRDALDAEWELIILAGLDRVGAVEHEPDLGGSSRLDVRFSSPVVRFIADVRTVSDQTAHRANPIDALASEFYKIGRELEAENIQGGFDFRVDGISAAPWRGHYKTRLILPEIHEFPKAIFDRRFADFLETIRSEPLKIHYHSVNTEKASVSIVFNPGGVGRRSYSFPPYDLPHDATRNVVFGALESKSRQIKKAGQREPGELAGIFLCDGSCAGLRSYSAPGTVTLDTIIATFLRGSQTVDFVCVVDVREASSSWHSTGALEFQARVWAMRLPDFGQKLEDLFRDALQHAPLPVRTPINTINQFKAAGASKRLVYANYRASTTMTLDSVEMSLRSVVEYIAGRLDRNEFERNVHPSAIEYLRRRLDSGSGIADITMAPAPGEDDDGLIIRFREHDAANAPFRVSSSSLNSESKD